MPTASCSEVAELLGCTAETIRNHARRPERPLPAIKRPGPDGGRWRFDSAAVVRWAIEDARRQEQERARAQIDRLGAALACTADSAGPMSIEEARRRKLAAEARLAELDQAERSGQLVPVEDVKTNWVRIATWLRQGFLNLPGRAAPLVHGVKTIPKIQAILRDLVYEILEHLSETVLEVEVEPKEKPTA